MATAAAATAATAVATTACAATTRATAATVGAAEAARTLFARTGFIDDDGPTGHRLAVHALDRGLRLGIRTHLDEAEALRAARVTVHHHLGGRDGPKLGESLLEFIVTHTVGQIAYVQLVAHGAPFFL